MTATDDPTPPRAHPRRPALRALPGHHDPARPDQPDRDDPAEDGARRIRLTPAASIRMRPVHWTWTDRIPAGAITLIPGREGIGKSLLLAWLTAQITRGTLPGLHHGTPRPVIYAASEDSWAQTIVPRLHAAGADLDLVYRADVDTGAAIESLSLPRDCTGLAAEITRLGVALLAADPLLSLIHAGIDTHRDRDLRTALEPLARLADTTGCAVVGLAHFNKSATPDALNLITGSRAFSAVARAVIAIARDPDDESTCVMSQAKNNLGRLALPSLRYRIDPATIPTPDGPSHVGRLTFTGETARTVADILADSSDPTERPARQQAAAWLTHYLAAHGGQAARDDILRAAQAAGFAARTVERAQATAGITTSLSGFPARSLWHLNPDHTP